MPLTYVTGTVKYVALLTTDPITFHTDVAVNPFKFSLTII